MKKAAIVLGTVAIILTLLALLFKLHHWVGAGALMLYGSIFNGIIVIPVVGIVIFQGKSKHKNLYLYGIISAFILSVGVFFKLNHWPLSDIIHATGTGLLIIFIILVAMRQYKSLVS